MATSTLIEQILSDLEKTASSEKKAEESEKKEEKKIEVDEKKTDKDEKKVEKDLKKTEADEKKEEASEKKMASLSDAQLDKLSAYVERLEEEEKMAELEKVAEELETQGRFMYHGFAREQLKIAYVLGQITDEDLAKTAETLGWDVKDILKTADTHEVLVGDKPEQNYRGMGTEGGPAADTVAGGKDIKPAAKAPGQVERVQDGASELKQMKDIINKVKQVRKESTNIPMNA
jgi:hypothetical protein